MAAQFSIQDNKPWKTRFYIIWGGQAISILGSQLVQFALIWYLTIKTGSATVLATTTLVGMLPYVILGPFIGTLVDRWNRRETMLSSDSPLALAPPSAFTLAVTGALLVGFLTPITMGPFFAFIQSRVEPDMQARISSLISSVGTGISPLGLVIASPVADRVGIQAWFELGGFLCIFMAVTGLCIPAVMNMEQKGSIQPEPVHS